MIELTHQQHEALNGETPPRVLDPETQETYVLLKLDVYDRLRRLVDEDDGLEMHQVGVLIEEAMREEDAEDPLLESYQNYRRPSGSGAAIL